jgi:hypothetical protein
MAVGVAQPFTAETPRTQRFAETDIEGRILLMKPCNSNRKRSAFLRVLCVSAVNACLFSSILPDELRDSIDGPHNSR